MKNSNVAIDQGTNEVLTEFCNRTKQTKKDFISTSLKYFNDYSINPTKHEKPTQEIEKMHKRIEDIFKFSKAQERDILKPHLVEIAKNNIKHNQEVEELRKSINATLVQRKNQHIELLDQAKKQHQEQVKLLEDQIKELKYNTKNYEDLNFRLKDAFLILTEVLDKKKEGFIERVSKKLGI
jgi:hypothetical protein